MDEPTPTPPAQTSPAEHRFADLVDELIGIADVTPPRGTGRFGSDALRVDGKIFAMLRGERLVVKLPTSRITALMEAGEGVRFDAHKGTPMKEWLSVAHERGPEWSALAREALSFVRSR